MFKIYFVILFCFTGQLLLSQTVINIIPPVNTQDDYQLVNISDTAFIETGHSDDMGKAFENYYRLKTNIPDGEYLICIYDKPDIRGFIKNSQMDSVWTKYNASGTPTTVITYKNGLIHGDVLTFYNNGSVLTICNYINNRISGPAVTFHKSGNIKYITFFENGEPVNREVYDEDGKYLYDVKQPDLNKMP